MREASSFFPRRWCFGAPAAVGVFHQQPKRGSTSDESQFLFWGRQSEHYHQRNRSGRSRLFSVKGTPGIKCEHLFYTNMLLRVIISVLLTLLLSYLLYQARNSFWAGTNPFLILGFILFLAILFVVNYRITTKVELGRIRTFLRIWILLGIFVPVLSIFFRKPDINDAAPPRRYIDTSANG